MAIDPAEANAATGLDRSFLLVAIQLETDTQALLDETAQAMAQAVIDNARGAEVPQDSAALEIVLIALVVLFFVKLAELMAAAVFKIATAKKNSAIDQFIPLLRSAGARDAANAFKIELGNYPADVSKRFVYRRVAGNDYDGRIKSIREGTEKTVRNIVQLGVRDGKSAKQIAKDIEQYISPLPGTPKAQPFEIYRKRFGRPKNFTPKGIKSGTLQANALMVARTESAEVYRQATDDFYRDKPWVDHFRWVLSNTHVPRDVCDVYAERKWEKKVKRPFSHPYCLCDWIAVPVSFTELREMAIRGEV